MKTLKFKDHLVAQILAGTKTATWRLFDDKDLQIGDELSLVNGDTGEEFAHAIITSMKEKKLGELEEGDFVGHETYRDEEDMLSHYRSYYGDRVTLDTVVKIIDFKLT